MSSASKLNVPSLPCGDVSNLEKWKQYASDMSALSTRADISQIMQQCISKNGSTCYKNESCTNELFESASIALANPKCLTCIMQSPECQVHIPELKEIVSVMNVLHHPTVTALDVQGLVQSKCKLSVDLNTSQKIAYVLNDDQSPQQQISSSLEDPSPGWVSQQTWIGIGVLAFILFSVVGLFQPEQIITSRQVEIYKKVKNNLWRPTLVLSNG